MLWTAVAHIVTGVTSFAWSMTQLGWILGPLCIIICFADIPIVSTFLLCNCFRYPGPEFGAVRNRSYTQAVKLYLEEPVLVFDLSSILPKHINPGFHISLDIQGRSKKWICGVLVQESLYGTETRTPSL
ncbi:hypothetical protein MLD38_034275 [Melastoma candidum]|uniref:Uncharacterized protein n=1 Tax=Melastoma candidum TaxID=119954 RepID=A0ACB9M9I7_9MYRT|nr:hypothetical protein MLD38_034275 [Melastoma candidum]